MTPAATAAMGNFAPSGVSGEKAKSIVYVLIVLVIIVVVILIVKRGLNIFDGITGGVGSFLETIGLKKSEEEKAIDAAAKAADQVASQIDSPFNPQFYKTAPAGTTLFTAAKADALAKQIWDSVGTFTDDPEAGLAAIKQATNWASVSWLSDRFNTKYGRDLYGWLQIKYDTTAQKDILTKIVTYARSLKKY